MMTKPKTLLYGEALATVEQRIVDALPDIVEALIARAREGDTKAAVYLCDRILGRVAASKAAPVEDRRAPYTEDDFRLDEEDREVSRGLFAGFGARNGA